jgi:hypothetical protein
MSNIEISPLPEPDNKDRVHKFISTTISLVPLPLVQEFFTTIMKPPLDKRRDDWLNLIATAIQELQSKYNAISPENLSENLMFLNAVVKATRMALETQQQDRLEYLRNIVLNSAISPSLQESLQMTFFQFIEIFTDLHIAVLKFFDEPTWGQALGYKASDSLDLSDIMERLYKRFPSFIDQRSLLSKILSDLYV